MRNDGHRKRRGLNRQQTSANSAALPEKEALQFEQLEAALEVQQALLGIVMDQMPCGVVIAEAPSGKLLFHNEEAVRLSRHPLIDSADYKGYARYGGLYSDHQPYEPADYPLARALTGKTIRQEEMMYRRGDGTLTWFSVSAAPVRNGEGDITMAVTTFQDISAFKQHEAELTALNTELEERVEERTRKIRELASALTLAEQKERRRVASILHDDFQQQLYGVQLKLHTLRPTGSASELEEGIVQANDIVKVAINTAQNLMLELSPPVLKGEGLGRALQWLGDQMQDRFGIKVDVQRHDDAPVPGDDMRVLLFQTVRELLLNAVEHAGTNRAWVSLCRRDNDLVIEVIDRGVGFDQTTIHAEPRRRKKLGLEAARERLILFGGHMHIESQPGAGTRILLGVPIANL